MFQRLLLLLTATSLAVSSVARGDHRLSHDASVPVLSTAELPRTPFKAVLPPPHRREPWLYGDFTLAGPLGPFTALPPYLTKAVVDGTDFAIGYHEAFEFELGSSMATQLTPAGVPEVSWTMGIAFDPVRNHVLISTAGVGGHLYALDPVSRDWSVLSDLDGVDLEAIAFSEARDRLFGVERKDSSSSFSLHEYTAEGELLQTRDLIVPVLTRFADRTTQLVEVDEFLALLQYPQGAREPTIHVIRPETGEAWLVVPEPASTIQVLCGAAALLGLRVCRAIRTIRG